MNTDKKISLISSDDPLLRKAADAVDIENIHSYKRLVKSMFALMYKHDGVGLAAPQVGISLQIFVVHVPRHFKKVCFNPTLRVLDSTQTKDRETCLSLPGKAWLVPRPSKIRLDFYNQKGNFESLLLENYLARVASHEYDHLVGTLISDLSSAKAE